MLLHRVHDIGDRQTAYDIGNTQCACATENVYCVEVFIKRRSQLCVWHLVLPLGWRSLTTLNKANFTPERALANIIGPISEASLAGTQQVLPDD